MKKFIAITSILLAFPIFAGCEVSNTELANSLEGNMTRLVYSVGYLDSITTEELSSLVNNSSYFTHSSLFNGSATNQTETPATETTENVVNNASNVLNGGLDSGSFSTDTNNTLLGGDKFRSLTYSSNLTQGTATSSYSSGTVNMELLESCAENLNQILLDISAKRGIIMLYCTDLRSGRASLSPENKSAIAEYNDIIKETTNYLNSNTGTLTSHFNGISSISGNENSAELINAKLIRANEILKTRYAKLDTCIDSMNAILNILVTSIGANYAELYNATLINSSQGLTMSGTDNNVSNTTFDGNNYSTEEVLDGTNEDNMLVDETPTTYPAKKDNNCCDTKNNNCCPTTENKNDSGDTIINYNYEGGNSSSIDNASPLSGGLTKGVNSEKIPAQNVDSMIVDAKNQPSTLEIRPFETNEALGSITLQPFVFEENDVTRKIPKW